MAGSGLLAYVLVSKFDDHLPLCRLNEIFACMGVDIPDSTLVGWCGRAMKVLQPLTERIEAEIMASALLHWVIPPFLTGRFSRIQAAFLSFCIGVIPPMPMLGRSLLYVQSQRVA